jgi:uncharacterized membrane protein HdeD (DUF308 family)
MMDKILKRTKTGLIITGIVFTLLGIVMFMQPLITLTLIVLIAGWVLLVLGVITLIDSFVHRKDKSSSSAMGICGGIIELVIGLCIIFSPATFTWCLSLMLGIIITITGIGDIAESLGMHKAGMSNWGIALAMGILTLIMGILAVVAPFAFAGAMVIIMGISLVLGGVTEVIAGIMMPTSMK